MSLVNRKRPLDNEASPSNSAKRRQCSPVIAACSPSTVALLLALFPSMTDESVIAVLTDCGGDVDEAIKRLGHLSLAKTEANAAMQPPSSSAAATQPHAPPPGSTEEGNEGDPGPTQPASTSSSTRQEPRNPEEWVEGLVSEMAAATNMQDARSRAVKVLSSFERFVLDQSSGSGSGPGPSSLSKINEELSKENHILKRAVQIQNQKLVERAQAQEAQARHQEAEVSHYRQVINQQQEQIRQLELNNYSLALHLQRAEHGGGNGGGGGQMGGHHRPPDIF